MSYDEHNWPEGSPNWTTLCDHHGLEPIPTECFYCGCKWHLFGTFCWSGLPLWIAGVIVVAAIMWIIKP